MKTYTVTCTETCTECRGSGYIDNDLWPRLRADLGEGKLTGAFIKQWELDHNLGENIGPESFSCGECNGEGKLESEVPLAAALRELGVVVKT
jgi:hypothetical protein